MRLSDLDYELPEELIAQQPLARRDASRLLVVDVGEDEVEDRSFAELPRLLPPSLLIFNDTRVFPARLLGNKSTGGQVEVSGALGLDQGLPANLRVALRGVTLVDPRLYRVIANADTHAGVTETIGSTPSTSPSIG